jgi:hypothetical protein
MNHCEQLLDALRKLPECISLLFQAGIEGGKAFLLLAESLGIGLLRTLEVGIDSWDDRRAANDLRNRLLIIVRGVVVVTILFFEGATLLIVRAGRDQLTRASGWVRTGSGRGRHSRGATYAWAEYCRLAARRPLTGPGKG